MATLLLDRPAPPADDATRREFMIGGLSLAALFAGCGTDRQPEAASSPTPAGRTIAHQHGTTDVPAAPERIVTRGFIDHERAEMLVAEVEARFADKRRQHPEFRGATAVLAEGPTGGSFTAYPPDNPRALILPELGFDIPAEILELSTGPGSIIEISAERLDLFDQDVVIWLGSDPTLVKETPLHGQLKAVREGREVFTDELTLVALAYGSVLSLPYALDRLVPMLAAAVDGDPTTEVPS